VNLFDLVAGSILVISALIGFSRGAVLEVVTLFAFTVAATLSVYLLPFTTPIALKSVHPAWAANAVAAAASFLVAYIGLRVLGAGLSRAIRAQRTLGSLDRTVGLAFGVVRALVVLGVVYLVFSSTPFGPPGLMTRARLYPLARGSGVALATLAPGGIHNLQGFGQSLRDRMSGVPPQPPPGAVEAGQEYGEPDGSAPPPPADDRLRPAHRPLQIEGAASPPRRHHRPTDASVE
jgi:membrane protein required for colicin V production